MQTRAILFDLDGTLLDTITDLKNSMNAVLKQLGYPLHDTGAYKIFVGDGIRNLVTRALPQEARIEAIIEKALAMMKDEYAARDHEYTRPYEGIMDMLGELVSNDLYLAILSNKPHEATIKVVKHYFPGIPFKGVYGARKPYGVKPDAAQALDIIEWSGISHKDWAYLGDTGTDMQTAVNAHVYPVGALWGFRESRELLENGARVLINRPAEFFHALP